MARGTGKKTELPTRQQIIAFIEESPRRVGKREIARAFKLRGEDRGWLNGVLKELKDEGLLEGGRRRGARKGHLPEVAVIEVSHVDMDGEVVCRPAAWRGDDPPPVIFLMPSRRRRVAPGPGDRVLARLRRTEDGTYEARAMRVLGPAARTLLGVLEPAANGALLRPTDRKHRHEYFVPEDHLGEAVPGDYVTAEVLPGGLRSHRARVVERLGARDDPSSISLVAIHAHGIPLAFPAEAISLADGRAPATLDGRDDLRSMELITIDGADARDFDDAVWATADDDKGNPGGWRIVVAIADVAWYVRPGDPLDRAAVERGNSVYFPDRVVPMLPESLSNGLCSLRPKEDRACVAAEVRIDAKGKILSHRFRRGLMRSVARLTYEQVQEARDGRPDAATAPLMDDVIAPLYGAYGALLAAREARGTLDLELPERQIVLDEAGRVARIVPRPRLDSHRLIEEFMIAANVAAAETLQKAGAPAMRRVHEPPEPGKLEALRESLDAMGFRLAKGAVLKPGDFTGILARVAGTDEAELIGMLILRSQTKAEYAPADIGHFGLALRRYCHFTSPIRRYADVLVHRALISTLGLGEGGLPDGAEARFGELGGQISTTERRAVAAERDATDRFAVAFLADRVGATFAGRINGVTRFGLFITLEETGADGLAPASGLPWDRYRHDPVRHRLIGDETRIAYTIGERVTVKLDEADPATGSLIFSIVEGGAVADDAPKGRKSGRRSGGRRRGKGPRRNRQ
ncbi:MAG: ribonuclease R [Alphaproteobacteria bacterium]|nr:ribonuclease R [Alphaproteobacteria bacterium]